MPDRTSAQKGSNLHRSPAVLEPLAPIGVFDSGVGGLSVLQALQAELPDERYVYVADSGHAPYGERGDAYVSQRSHAIVDYLRRQHHVKALVVACNTATAAAIHEIRAACPDVPLVGIEPALKPASRESRTKHVGVIATRGTVTSHKFQALLESLRDAAHFTVQACDGLAHAIEREAAVSAAAGDADSPAVEALCARYLGEMGPFGAEPGRIDTLVLGCTHYVFARRILSRLAGPAVRLVDTGEPVARQTRRLLSGLALLAPPTSEPYGAGVQLFTTGSLPDLQNVARHWLGLPAQDCRAVTI